jgi:hypothetical protein
MPDMQDAISIYEGGHPPSDDIPTYSNMLRPHGRPDTYFCCGVGVALRYRDLDHAREGLAQSYARSMQFFKQWIEHNR